MGRHIYYIYISISWHVFSWLIINYACYSRQNKVIYNAANYLSLFSLARRALVVIMPDRPYIFYIYVLALFTSPKRRGTHHREREGGGRLSWPWPIINLATKTSNYRWGPGSRTMANNKLINDSVLNNNRDRLP